MTEPQLLSAAQVEPELLDNFLSSVYSPLRSEFLKQHGAWWHRSNTNQLVILVESQVVGYCAVIPTKVWIAGHIHEALWWVDLIIAPAFRGRGLQTLFDRHVRETADLLLGFPNALAARIHRKHGWGVREDMRVLMLPLLPDQTRMVRRMTGKRGLLFRTGSIGLAPLAWGWRAWLTSRRAPRAWMADRLDGRVFSEIFARTRDYKIQTTWRDADFFAWRYGNAPKPGEYRYLLAGDPDSPSHCLIARHLVQPDGTRQTRVLDLFGDFRDSASLRDLLTLVVQDAISHGSSQVTLMVGHPNLKKIATQLGFLFSVLAGFCWWSSSPALMSALAGEIYWTLGDSDNDAQD